VGDESAGTHLSLTSELGKEFAIVTNLVVPKTGGMNTTKVTIVRWIKSEGDAFKQGEPIVELETEKVSYELDAPVDGVLLKILVREPAEVEVGGVLGYIGKAGDAVPAS
jgi:pyruvate/2-oxoglutarate dehydrogenase complex dihydrolipoamide acyltransferase (E2) component